MIHRLMYWRVGVGASGVWVKQRVHLEVPLSYTKWYSTLVGGNDASHGY